MRKQDISKHQKIVNLINAKADFTYPEGATPKGLKDSVLHSLNPSQVRPFNLIYDAVSFVLDTPDTYLVGITHPNGMYELITYDDRLPF